MQAASTHTSPASPPAALGYTMAAHSCPAPWRPWLVTAEDAQRGARRAQLACPYARAAQSASGLITDKEQSFQHPVRLFWPKSKSYDYLYSCGEVLLKTFPVQATISFYEESNSEDEDEEEEEEEEEEDSKVEICQTREHHHKAAAAFPCYN